MPRKECPLSPNTAITVEKCSIPNLPQGACLAQEVGGVGGETRCTARVRAACGERSRTGFAPNKSTLPAQRSFISGGGSGAEPLGLHPLPPTPNPHTNRSAHRFERKRRS